MTIVKERNRIKTFSINNHQRRVSRGVVMASNINAEAGEDRLMVRTSSNTATGFCHTAYLKASSLNKKRSKARNKAIEKYYKRNNK